MAALDDRTNPSAIPNYSAKSCGAPAETGDTRRRDAIVSIMASRFFRLLQPLVFPALLFSPGRHAASQSPPPDEGWKEVSKQPALVIYCREKKDSPIREYKAIGTVAAPAWVVKNVIDDRANYPAFMPYVSESKTLAANPDGSIIAYQRLNTPFVNDRDYVLRIRFESRESRAGTVYINRWQAVEDRNQPERQGIVRVKTNEGSWLLEPADANSTRATYCLYTNPGGTIPAAVINYANKNAIPKVFAAIEKQAAEKKYREHKPVVPASANSGER